MLQNFTFLLDAKRFLKKEKANHCKAILEGSSTDLITYPLPHLCRMIHSDVLKVRQAEQLRCLWSPDLTETALTEADADLTWVRS